LHYKTFKCLSHFYPNLIFQYTLEPTRAETPQLHSKVLGASLARKYQTRVEVTESDKRSSLPRA